MTCVGVRARAVCCGVFGAVCSCRVRVHGSLRARVAVHKYSPDIHGDSASRIVIPQDAEPTAKETDGVAQSPQLPLGIHAVAISPNRTSLSSVFTAAGWLAACRRKVAAERALSTLTSTRSPSKTKARRARGRSCQCGTKHTDTQAQRHTDGNAVETGQST